MVTHISIFTRIVIWLMAIAIPVQGVPAASCGCSESCIHQSAKSDGQSCCCALAKREAGTCCCSRQEATCCRQSRENSGSPCQCGDNCRCGHPEPSHPFTPVRQESQTERIVQDANSFDGMIILPASKTTKCHPLASSQPNASTALDRCAALCRFTL